MNWLWEFTDRYAVAILLFGGLFLGIVFAGISLIFSGVRGRFIQAFPLKKREYSLVPTADEMREFAVGRSLDHRGLDLLFELGWITETERRELLHANGELSSQPRLTEEEMSAAVFRLVVVKALAGWGKSRDMRSQLGRIADGLKLDGLWNDLSKETGARENSVSLRNKLARWVDSRALEHQ